MKRVNGAMIVFGAIFAGVGLLFFIIGLWVGFFLDPHAPGVTVNGDQKTIGVFFMLFSSIFIAVGAWQIIKQIKQAAKGKRLLEEGTLYWAEVSNVLQDTSVTINGRNPSYIECWCTDNMGLCRNFKSNSQMNLPSMLSFGSKVAVYVNPEDDEDYFVDLSQFTPAQVNMNMNYAQNNFNQNNTNYPNYPNF